ncbi:TPA: hypothetical protein ACFRGQ_000755 [Neisseria lactamica]|nr:hypothetical protein [Neisseria lactamica]
MALPHLAVMICLSYPFEVRGYGLASLCGKMPSEGFRRHRGRT